MTRKVITTLALLISSLSFGQTYSYSFKGELAASNISNLEKRCSAIQGVSKTKIKYKEDSQGGEFILILDEMPSDSEASDEHPFSSVLVKKLLLELNLSPQSFRLIEK